MFFIGDVHGCFYQYEQLIKNKKIDCSIQLGDMGVGFPIYIKSLTVKKYSYGTKTFAPNKGKNHKFIRGNHDDPEVCEKHPQYLGDFGYLKNDIFFISGGYSIDKQMRTEWLDWWRDEELSFVKQKKVIELYKKHKPSVVISHECPTEIKKHIINYNNFKTKITSQTEKLLQSLLDINRPDYWIFGHYHIKKIKKIKETNFIALDEFINGKIENCYFELPNLKF